MNRRILCTLGGIGFLLFVLTTSGQADPWGTIPDWVSSDSKFTMSVALADLDNDNDLDLIAGNYNYPYQWDVNQNPASLQMDSIGAYLVAYEWNEQSETFEEPVVLSGERRCIDCIAIGDYDSDGDLDIAMGLVVGKGDDGGVIVLDNRFDEYEPGTYPATLAGYFSSQDPQYYWSPDESYDCHCVRWFDYNCDGHLDLAALVVPGKLIIYPYGENGLTVPNPEISYDFITGFQSPSSGSGEGGLTTTSLKYDARMPTIEFGDMDMDGDLDLFVNLTSELPIVFKHLYEELGPEETRYYNMRKEYWQAKLPAGFDDGKKIPYCASFGFFDGDTTKLALAVGSMRFDGDTDHPGYFYPWRNDVYTLDIDTQTGEGKLIHSWQSREYMHSETHLTQPVTDIQWARISGDDDMDLVTASYPVYNKELLPGHWDRGKEQYYEDPDVDHGASDPQYWTWVSSEPDLSTSQALGDIDNPGASGTTSQVFLCGDTPEDVIGLFYIRNFPAYKIEGVYWGLSDTGPYWYGIPLDQWCADPLNGWISVSRTYLAGLITQDPTYIKIDYLYSPYYDLAIGNDGPNVVYYLGAGGSQYEPASTHEVVEVNTTHTYLESNYITPDPGGNVNCMSPDAIGTGFNCVMEWTYGADHQEVQAWLAKNPDIKNVRMGANWNDIEIFQGHYFWDWVDKNFDEIYAASRDGFFFSDDNALWTRGNWTLDMGDPPADDYRCRPSDQRLQAMWVRSVVNRYRPGGIYGGDVGGWGDQGVCSYHFLNEPEIRGYMREKWGEDGEYWEPSASDLPIVDLAELMYRQYQMIKEISLQGCGNEHLLEVVSPNWSDRFPADYEKEINVYTEGEFSLPPMPVLNALNDVVLDFIPNSPTDVLWNYTDYICQQMWCTISNIDDLTRLLWDPFNPTVACPQHPDLHIGVEQGFWGYYTAGLRDYIESVFGSGVTEANWDPVMDEGPEHPFMETSFKFELSEGLPDDHYPKPHWIAAEIAELFSIDVFPEDENIEHRLLNFIFPLDRGNDCYRWVPDLCQTLFNKDGIHFHQYAVEGPGFDQPPVYRYTYRVGDTDEYIHFIKTEWDLDNLEDCFVTDEWDLYLENDQNPPHYPQTEDVYLVNCFAPEGNQFQKMILWNTGPPPEPVLRFSAGETGPGMLIIHEPDEPIVQQEGGFAQSIELHPGWNLVSWHLDIEDPDGVPPEDLFISEVLGYNQEFYDLFPQGGPNEIWWYNHTDMFYPQNDWDWFLTDAYYFNFNQTYAWNLDESRFPQITIEGYPIDPDPAWDLDNSAPWEEPWEDPLAENWYFICYPVPGYTKVATIYNTNPPSGDDISYKGPFHYLVWDPVDPSQHRTGQYLTIVKSDEGKVYIPYYPPRIIHEIDTLKILEPGKGYFLGFKEDSPTIWFEGWTDYPGWPTEGISADPKSSEKQIASANHFQFNKYTHWSYPVIIDTFAIEGIELESGDEFGILTPEDLCVGAATYMGGFPLVIVTWADDIATPDVVDGYQDGDEMTMVLYDVSANEEIVLDLGPQTASIFDDPVAPRYGGFNQGFYALKSLTRGIKSVQSLPLEYSMGQNYPNPFNSETVIPLELPQRSMVRIELFDVAGRNLGIIYQGIKEAGWPKIRYNASERASGVYFYRITSEGLERGGKYNDVGKMLLLK